MAKYDAFEGTAADPWAAIAEDRARCPVEFLRSEDGFEYHRVNSYDLVREVSRRHDDFSNRMGVVPSGGYANEEEQVLEYADPPEHTMHRQLVGKAFSAARVNDKVDRIQEIADDLVDEIAQRGNSFKLRYEFGRQLPAKVISEILGVPLEERDQFIRWSEIGEEGVGDVVRKPEAIAADEAFLDYSKRQLLERLENPRDDLLSTIIQADIDGERLTLTQAAAMVRLLLTAGNGTTSIGISNLIYQLETRPDVKARLLADMDGLLDSAIEEGYRFDCPVQGNLRGVKHDSEIAGHPVKQGDRIYAFYASANHDPGRYENPDQFIIDRDWAKEPRHFAFGFGVHFCLGAELARAETKVAIKTLYTRLPNLRMKEGYVPQQVPGMTFRSWSEIEMVFDGAARTRLSASA